MDIVYICSGFGLLVLIILSNGVAISLEIDEIRLCFIYGSSIYL